LIEILLDVSGSTLVKVLVKESNVSAGFFSSGLAGAGLSELFGSSFFTSLEGDSFGSSFFGGGDIGFASGFTVVSGAPKERGDEEASLGDEGAPNETADAVFESVAGAPNENDCAGSLEDEVGPKEKAVLESVAGAAKENVCAEVELVDGGPNENTDVDGFFSSVGEGVSFVGFAEKGKTGAEASALGFSGALNENTGATTTGFFGGSSSGAALSSVSSSEPYSTDVRTSKM
jgi:hypothetical protein